MAESITLSFEFEGSSGISGSGSITGYDTYLDSELGRSIFQATGGSIELSNGPESHIGTFALYDVSYLAPEYWGYQAYDPFYGYPAGSGYGWNNKFNNDYLWEENAPGVVFADDTSSRIIGIWSISTNMVLSLYDSIANSWNDYILSSFEAQSTPATPPTLQSSTATNNQLILTFSEDIMIAGGGILNPAYATITVNGENRRISTSQITESKLIITLSGRSLDSAASISISYDPPLSNDTGSGFITDLSGNALASISSQVIDTFTTTRLINKCGIGAAYKNLILAGTNVTGFGNTKDNTITGNEANNSLDGLAGADTMIGGKGNDHYIIDSQGDVVIELESEGTDTVQSVITHVLGDHVENLVLIRSSAINGTGNSADNTVTGNSAANILNGNGGRDYLIGGKGNDTYIVDSIDDTITESGLLSDIDSVESSVSWILGRNLDNLTLTGSNGVNGTGNNLNNTIIGNSASNTLDGGSGGTDRLTGLDGADIFNFSARPTSFRKTSADHITDFLTSQDKIQISKRAFGITASTATLSVVSGASAVTSSLATSALFIYDTNSGELHWNQNGISNDAGSGGVLAILESKSTLSAGDLMLV